MKSLSSLKMDKSRFTVTSLFDQSDDKAYLHSKTSSERLQAMELIRQIHYGYDPSSVRLQRVLTVTQLTSDESEIFRQRRIRRAEKI